MKLVVCGFHVPKFRSIESGVWFSLGTFTKIQEMRGFKVWDGKSVTSTNVFHLVHSLIVTYKNDGKVIFDLKDWIEDDFNISIYKRLVGHIHRNSNTWCVWQGDTTFGTIGTLK